MTKHEKRSLFYFLSLYLGSSFLLLSVVAYLYFVNAKEQILLLERHGMKTESDRIAKEIVYAHMSDKGFDTINLKSEYEVLLFDEQKKPLLGATQHDIDFLKTVYSKDGFSYFVNSGTFLHLGVGFVVIKAPYPIHKVKELALRVVGVLLFGFVFVGFVGYFLSKMFLRPMKNEIEKLDRFVKDSTHELNTPIAALLMSVKHLKKEQNEKIMRRISASAKRISDTYNDMTYLLLRDIDKKVDVELPLDALIAERIDYFAELLESKKIAVDKNLEPLMVLMDKNRAQRLIDNLISNAIKYNKQGGKIKITTTKQTLTIEDSGIGIEQKNLQNIFKRYFREGESGGGFGIGLDIIASICREYGIKIDVSSTVGVGSTFTLSFHTYSTQNKVDSEKP